MLARKVERLFYNQGRMSNLRRSIWQEKKTWLVLSLQEARHLIAEPYSQSHRVKEGAKEEGFESHLV